jgi:hypothetical protein
MACVCDFVDVLAQLQKALNARVYDLPSPEDRRRKPQTWAYLEHMRRGAPPSRKALLMDIESIREATRAPLPRHHHKMHERMVARTREALDKLEIITLPIFAAPKRYRKKKAYFTPKRVVMAAREAYWLSKKRFIFYCSKPL